MASGLVAELRHKLAELDSKVLHYQQQTLADFHEFYYNRIRDCDSSTIATINSALLPTFSDYQNLHPSLPDRESRETPPSDPAPASAAEAAFQPLSPAAASTTTSESQSTRSHDRETELQGIFVPTYLPLLEAAPIPARTPPSPLSPSPQSAPVSTFAAAAPLIDDKANERLLSRAHPEPSGSINPSKMDQTVALDADSPQSDSLQSIRPDHQRRSTDDTTSSAVSDKSTLHRRSALRRSSSPSRTPQSPRRVRFEVMGAEVLPTASPRNSEMSTPRPSSPSAAEQKSMLDDDDDEPPPRKISSSEALRALSRTPMEGTVWTVVNPESDEASSEQTNSRPTTPASPAKVENKSFSESTRSPPKSLSLPSDRMKTTGPSEDGVRDDIDGDDDDDDDDDEAEEDDSSEEEFLSMGKAKSFSSKKPITSAPLTVQVKPVSGSHGSPKSQPPVVKGYQYEGNGAKASHEDDTHHEDEDPFHFEMAGLSAPPRARNQARPETPPESHEESDTEVEDGQTAAESSGALSTSATSTAVPINKHRPQPAPSTPTRVQFQVGSVGSYKGRPINMPVVRDPELMAQAESLGDFDTFVGGLDGRSGVDEGNMSSFRASFRQGSTFSGTPRSMTERFLREEMEEEQKRNVGRS